MTRSLATATAVLHREGNHWVAGCLEVGTVSQGGTQREAIANLREATELYLEEFPAAAPTRRSRKEKTRPTGSLARTFRLQRYQRPRIC